MFLRPHFLLQFLKTKCNAWQLGGGLRLGASQWRPKSQCADCREVGNVVRTSFETAKTLGTGGFSPGITGTDTHPLGEGALVLVRVGRTQTRGFLSDREVRGSHFLGDQFREQFFLIFCHFAPKKNQKCLKPASCGGLTRPLEVPWGDLTPPPPRASPPRGSKV